MCLSCTTQLHHCLGLIIAGSAISNGLYIFKLNKTLLYYLECINSIDHIEDYAKEFELHNICQRDESAFSTVLQVLQLN